MNTSTFKNFIPESSGAMKRRPGCKYIPWGRKTFWTRIKMWWNGDPISVNQITAFNGQLFAATDRGLYVMHNDVMKPVPCVVEWKP
jgi:hypothetical protein